MKSLRVFLAPTGLHSRAMVRVANALTEYAPEGVTIVGNPSPNYCDLVVYHVIASDAIEVCKSSHSRGQRHAIIQYCLETAGGSINDWLPTWRDADLVWSYYDLNSIGTGTGFNFYHAPLGVDKVFHGGDSDSRSPLVITTGYVSGPCSEPIAEVWEAASRAGIEAIHVGPAEVEGMEAPSQWRAVTGFSDAALAVLYRGASWVSGLRHVEGFELPAAEGVVCGARPIVFRQPAMEHWYGDLATYVEDRHGEELVESLVEVFKRPRPVSESERLEAVDRFNWETICGRFWKALLGR